MSRPRTMAYIILNLIFIVLYAFPIMAEEASNPNEESVEESKKKIGLDIHGFCDVVFKNDYITPRGLLVTDTGLTIQVLTGLILNVYKEPTKFVNDIAIIFGYWNDIWTDQDSPTAGAWNEMDWFAGIEMGFAKNWKFRAQFIQFLSPPGNFRPENNAEFTLFYDDSKWKLPVTFNPYLRLFWAISGDSTVVVGKPGGTYYVEFGLIPTVVFNKCIPITFTVPTWISVGPSNFWNGGELALKHKKSHFGVFSTGLKGSISLEKFISQSLGKWYLDFGVQYYYLINDNLLQAQLFTLNLSSIHSAKRNVVVGFGGFGFEF